MCPFRSDLAETRCYDAYRFYSFLAAWVGHVKDRRGRHDHDGQLDFARNGPYIRIAFMTAMLFGLKSEVTELGIASTLRFTLAVMSLKSCQEKSRFRLDKIIF